MSPANISFTDLNKIHSLPKGQYKKTHALRAPNSRHPRTGLHKANLTFHELARISVQAIKMRAAEPREFEIPDCRIRNDGLAAVWRDASETVRRQTEALKTRRPSSVGEAALNRLTLDFIRNGAAPGGYRDDLETGNGRHRRLFSAAANLAEFGCPPGLAHALLTPVGLDCGLPPSEVRRQIDCGLAEGGRHRGDSQI